LAAPVELTRIPLREDTGHATAQQVRNVVHRLRPAAEDPVPLFVFDAGYDPIALTIDLADMRTQIAVRIRDDRVFSAEPPPREPGTTGRPPRHGLAFRLADPTNWPAPDATPVAEDPRYGRIEITAWREGAPQARPPWPLGPRHTHSHRHRHGDPHRSRAPTQAHLAAARARTLVAQI
jgi:hypothetical protein